MKRKGLKFNVNPINKYSYTFDFFLSDIAQIFNSGGMFGYHISYHLSKHLPLTIGYGSVTDFNQFSDLDIDVKSPVTARELDFNISYLKIKNIK